MLESSKKSSKEELRCDKDLCRFSTGCCCYEDDKIRELEMIQEYPIPSQDIETKRAMRERTKLRRHNDSSKDADQDEKMEIVIKEKIRQGDRKNERKKSRTMNIQMLGEEQRRGDQLYTIQKRGKKEIWKKIEAAIDSGAIDTVGNPNDFPGDVVVRPTKESKRNECWVAANGEEIPKLGSMTIEFGLMKDGAPGRSPQQSNMKMMKMTMKAGSVNKTLISASRLMEQGFETMLTRQPHLRNVKTGEKIHLSRKKGMYIMEMWFKVPMDEKRGPDKQGAQSFQRPG